MKYREVLAQVLSDRLKKEPKALIMGAGVADPKGVFGTTLEAHRLYPDRVIETPLSENMLTGACVGLALEGWKPIFVHARADFSVLSWEHIINTGAKLPFLHPDLDFNVTVRLLVGRGWGQGPLHSQSFHHLLASVPGVRVFYPVEPSHIENLYAAAFRHKGVSVIFEPRRLYELETVGASRFVPEAVVQIVTFGDCVLDAVAAARELRYEGVLVNVLSIEEWHQLFALARVPTLFVDVSPSTPGAFNSSPGAVWLGMSRRWLSPPFTPCPMAADQESQWYPSKEQIKEAVMEMSGKPYMAPDRKEPAESLALKGPF